MSSNAIPSRLDLVDELAEEYLRRGGAASVLPPPNTPCATPSTPRASSSSFRPSS